MILGEHSFLAFAKAGQEERGDRCIVTHARWEEWPGLGLEFHIAANRFLHHMVRYLVGTMVAIGQGERPAREMQRLLANEPELLTSPPAPPEGLFLVRVTYPEIL
jgi:tRNA pseudouridine38-40 synthase